MSDLTLTVNGKDYKVHFDKEPTDADIGYVVDDIAKSAPKPSGIPKPGGGYGQHSAPPPTPNQSSARMYAQPGSPPPLNASAKGVLPKPRNRQEQQAALQFLNAPPPKSSYPTPPTGAQQALALGAPATTIPQPQYETTIGPQTEKGAPLSEGIARRELIRRANENRRKDLATSRLLTGGSPSRAAPLGELLQTILNTPQALARVPATIPFVGGNTADLRASLSAGQRFATTNPENPLMDLIPRFTQVEEQVPKEGIEGGVFSLAKAGLTAASPDNATILAAMTLAPQLGVTGSVVGKLATGVFGVQGAQMFAEGVKRFRVTGSTDDLANAVVGGIMAAGTALHLGGDLTPGRGDITRLAAELEKTFGAKLPPGQGEFKDYAPPGGGNTLADLQDYLRGSLPTRNPLRRPPAEQVPASQTPPEGAAPVAPQGEAGGATPFAPPAPPPETPALTPSQAKALADKMEAEALASATALPEKPKTTRKKKAATPAPGADNESGSRLEGMGKGIGDALKDSIRTSITRTGDVPAPDRQANSVIAQAWDLVKSRYGATEEAVNRFMDAVDTYSSNPAGSTPEGMLNALNTHFKGVKGVTDVQTANAPEPAVPAGATAATAAPATAKGKAKKPAASAPATAPAETPVPAEGAVATATPEVASTPKKRGRPKKDAVQVNQADSGVRGEERPPVGLPEVAGGNAEPEVPAVAPAKRGPGRPRKTPLPEGETPAKEGVASGAPRQRPIIQGRAPGDYTVTLTNAEAGEISNQLAGRATKLVKVLDDLMTANGGRKPITIDLGGENSLTIFRHWVEKTEDALDYSKADVLKKLEEDKSVAPNVPEGMTLGKQPDSARPQGKLLHSNDLGDLYDTGHGNGVFVPKGEGEAHTASVKYLKNRYFTEEPTPAPTPPAPKKTAKTPTKAAPKAEVATELPPLPEPTPTPEVKKKGVGFNEQTSRNWQAGMNKATVQFESLLHRDLYDLGASVSQNLRAGDKVKKTPWDVIHAKADAMGHHQLGMKGEDVLRLAGSIYDDVKTQMKGVKDGETRSVTMPKPEPPKVVEAAPKVEAKAEAPTPKPPVKKTATAKAASTPQSQAQTALRSRSSGVRDNIVSSLMKSAEKGVKDKWDALKSEVDRLNDLQSSTIGRLATLSEEKDQKKVASGMAAIRAEAKKAGLEGLEDKRKQLRQLEDDFLNRTANPETPAAPKAPAEPAKSKGHIEFIGEHEYFKIGTGDVYRAPISNPMDTQAGVRSGSRMFSTARSAEQGLKLQRAAAAGEKVETAAKPAAPKGTRAKLEEFATKLERESFKEGSQKRPNALVGPDQAEALVKLAFAKMIRGVLKADDIFRELKKIAKNLTDKEFRDIYAQAIAHYDSMRPALGANAPSPERLPLDESQKYVAKNLNIEKLGLGQEAVDTISNLYRENEAAFIKARGSTTIKEIKARSRKADILPEGWENQTGIAYTDAQLHAMKGAVKTSLEQVERLRREHFADPVDPVKKGAFDAAIAVHLAQDIAHSGAAAMAGRAMRILAEPAETFEPKLRQALSDVFNPKPGPSVPEEAPAPAPTPEAPETAKTGESKAPESGKTGATRGKGGRQHYKLNESEAVRVKKLVAQMRTKTSTPFSSPIPGGQFASVIPELVEIGSIYFKAGVRGTISFAAAMREHVPTLDDETMKRVYDEVKNPIKYQPRAFLSDEEYKTAKAAVDAAYQNAKNIGDKTKSQQALQSVAVLPDLVNLGLYHRETISREIASQPKPASPASQRRSWTRRMKEDVPGISDYLLQDVWKRLRPAAEVKIGKRKADIEKLRTELLKTLGKDAYGKDLAPEDADRRLKAFSKRLSELNENDPKFRQKLQSLISEFTPKTTRKQVYNILGGGRSLITSIDVSAAGRQGQFLGILRPDIAAKSFAQQINAMKNEDVASDLNFDIRAKAEKLGAIESGLYLSPFEHSTELGLKEEGFATDLTQKIWGVRPSERGFVTYLNHLRVESYEWLSKGMDDAGKRAIANLINKATGRGKLGSFEGAAEGLAQIFFAPRFQASRVQMLVAEPFLTTFKREKSVVARKRIARCYVQYGMTMAAGMMLATKGFGGKTSLDPRGPDFLKVYYDNGLSIDFWAGFQQPFVLAARLLTKQNRPYGGKPVQDLTPMTTMTTAGSFLRSKAAPLVGSGGSLYLGKDIIGKDYGPVQFMRDNTIPMTPHDIYEAATELDVAPAVAMSLLSALGFNINIDKERNF